MALAVLTAGCTTAIPIRTEIEIDAPPEAVYAALIDFERYPEWNPYHVRVVGAPREGADLEVRVLRPDGARIDVPHVSVLRARPGRELTWGGGIRGLFRGEHRFLLEPTPGGGARLRHEEDFDGLFVGFADLPPEVLTEGYRRMNQALKAYLEAGRGALSRP